LELTPIKVPSRIGFLSYASDSGGCGVLRIMTPSLLLNQLKLNKVFIHSTFLSNAVGDPGFYRNFSFVTFQRSATKRHLEIHQGFRSNVQSKIKIPLIYEIDDDLFNIPEWNYAHPYYAPNKPYIEEMMRTSNGIVTSTNTLRNLYSKYNKNVKVIKNHLPKFIWGGVKEKEKPRGKVRILWAGSANHFRHSTMPEAIKGTGDFGSKLIDYIKKTLDDYQWCFMGALPDELEEVKSKLVWVNWANTWEYPNVVKAINADMGIAPLENVPFNNAKSNIKALEYTAMGIPGVYSNVAPYRNLSMVADNEDQIISFIEELAGDYNLRMDAWSSDYNTLRDQLWWEDNGNLIKYINTYLSIMGKKLP